MNMIRAGAALAATLLATGCTAAAPHSTQPVTESPTPSASTPSTATEKQVASVIAGYETAARKVAEDAGECRLLSVAGKGALDETKLITCYTGEVTLGLSSVTTARDLRGLTPPSSMTGLVSETLDKLDAIAGVELEDKCGPALEVPNHSKSCMNALGVLYGEYLSLSTLLDKWKPYL